MPMITASTGKFLVSGVNRALEPCTISTNSSCPAPTVSTATKVRPVVTSRSRFSPSMRYGSTMSNLWPTIEGVFCVATTLPVTLATNMRDRSVGFQEFFSLSGDDEFFVRRHDPDLRAARFGADRAFALGCGVGGRIER